MQDISTQHPDFSWLEADREMPRDLMGGTQRMRDAGKTYLPQETEEQPKDYQNRIARSFLYNGFRRSVLNLVGRIFDKPVNVTGHEDAEKWAEDVTNDGRDLLTFARSISHTGMSEGVCHIFTDFTQRGEVESRGEENQLAPRPYMVEIKPSDLFYWRYEAGMAGKTLAEIRYFDSYIDEAGKRQKQIRQYLGNGDWALYRMQSKENQQDADKWAVEEEGNTGLSGIPLTTIYFGDRRCYMGADPPLRDLAEVNVAHWQSSSDQRHVLHIARVPVLFTKMLGDGKTKLVIGVNRHINGGDPASDAKWIEHTGAAIGAGRQDLQDLEGQMAAMGIELLMANKPGGETATAHALSKKAEESTLQVIAKSIKRGLSDAMGWMAEWAALGADLVVEMNTDHDIVMSDATELQILTAARERRDLTRITFWAELKRRGILSDDFDPDVEAYTLDEAPPDGFVDSDMVPTEEAEED